MGKKKAEVMEGQIDIIEGKGVLKKEALKTEAEDITQTTETERAQILERPQGRTVLSFDTVIEKMKEQLGYVEDPTFEWDNVVAVLVIKLSETDSINKTRGTSNATHIELTAPANIPSGQSKTDDFFPTLVRNEIFQQWRLSVDARINKGNIQALQGNEVTYGNQWLPDKIETKRRGNLNASGGRVGNPSLHLGFGHDFRPVRQELYPKDYLIFVKQNKQNVFEIFGLKEDQFSQSDSKVLYSSPAAKNDKTVFVYENLQVDPKCYLRVFHEEIDISDKFFVMNEKDPHFEVGDEVLVFNPSLDAITHRIEITNIEESTERVYFRVKDVTEEPVTLEELSSLGFSEEMIQAIKQLSNPETRLVEKDEKVDSKSVPKEDSPSSTEEGKHSEEKIQAVKNN